MAGSHDTLVLVDVHRAQHFLVGLYLLYRRLLHDVEYHKRTLLGTSKQVRVRRIKPYIHRKLTQLMASVTLYLCARGFLDETNYGRLTKAYRWWLRQRRPYGYAPHRISAPPPRDNPLLLPLF